jgi:hypothetical protein
MLRRHVEPNGRPHLSLAQVLGNGLDDVVQVGRVILVVPFLDLEVNFVVFFVVVLVEWIVCGNLVVDLLF